MFAIYADGRLLAASSLLDDDAYAILTPTVTMSLGNEPGTASFIMKHTHYLYEYPQEYKTEIKVSLDEEIIFAGRVNSISTAFNGDKTISCESAVGLLRDSQQIPYAERTSTPIKELQRILDNHNTQVQIGRKFYLGEVTANKAGIETTFSSDSFSDSLTSITNELISRFGGYLNTRPYGDGYILDWLSDYGHYCDQSIEFGINLLEFNRDTSIDDVWSVLLPYADKKTKEASSEETDEQPKDPMAEKITIAEANKGSMYYAVQERVDLYGLITKTEEFDPCDTSEELMTQVEEWIQKNKELPTPSVTVTVMDLHRLNPDIEAFSLGDKINIIVMPLEIEMLLTCTQVTWNLFRPNETRLTLGTPQQKLTDMYASTVSYVNDVNTKASNAAGSAAQNREDIGKLGQDLNIQARNLNAVADKVDVQAEDIKLHSERLDQYGDRIEQAEASIEVHAGQIALKASSADVDYVTKEFTSYKTHNDGVVESLQTEQQTLMTRMNSVEIDLNGDDGKIGLKAITSNLEGDTRKLKGDYEALLGEVDTLGESVSKAEVAIDSANGRIDACATKTEMIEVDGRLTKKVNDAQIAIDAANSNILLKADSTEVDELGKRVDSAFIEIDGLTDQVTIASGTVEELNKSEAAVWDWIGATPQVFATQDNIISFINVSRESVTIAANRVNLYGYVTASEFQAEVAAIKSLFTNLSVSGTAVITGSFNAKGGSVLEGITMITGSMSLAGDAISKKTVEVVTGGSVSVSISHEGHFYAYASSSASTRVQYSLPTGFSAKFSPTTESIAYLQWGS